MRRGTLVGLFVMFLGLLVFTVAVQVWFLPSAVRAVVAAFPEVQPLAVPSVVWGVLAIACWQIASIIGVHLIAHAHRHHFNASTNGRLRTMIGCLLLFITLVVAALIALDVLGYSTPGVTLGLIGTGLLAVLGATALAIFLGSKPLAGRYSRA